MINLTKKGYYLHLSLYFMLNFCYDDITNGLYYLNKLKKTILNNYISVEFTTSNNKIFFEKIIEIFKKS